MKNLAASKLCAFEYTAVKVVNIALILLVSAISFCFIFSSSSGRNFNSYTELFV